MIFKKPTFLILLVFLLGNVGFVFSQTDTVPPQIINPDTIPVQYCTDSVPVAPNISIQNIKIDEDSEGMKVSIANYRRGEDILVWNEVHGFNYSWNNSYGHVEIKGAGSEKQYEEAIANIYYKNLAEEPNLNARSFSISLLDADYLPQTQHFYRYITALDITWKEAEARADTMRYYGLKGYLTTITSKAENDFIWTKIDGVGWIGASDEVEEGKWKWVTGPENGTLFWNGNQNGSPVPGQYNFWNNGEPNDTGGNEDFAHINANPNTVPKSWNDLPNATNPNAQYYRAKGFIVEFGGMPGDPEVKLSASASVQVSKIAFSDEREFEICVGESQMLNLVADTAYSYSWTPLENINDPTLSNPTVYPIVTTIYTAVGNLEFCSDTADFLVKVNPLPDSKLPEDTTICKGDFVSLDPGVHSSYLWSTGDTSRTIQVSDEEKYWVKLTSEFACEFVDTVEVKWSIRPELDYSTVDTLVCGSKTQTLTLSFINDASATTTLVPLDPVNSSVTDESTLTPTITVTEYRRYLFEMQIVDQYSCQFLDTLNIEFHNQPEAIILMDEEECKGYSLELSFGGVRVENALFTWFYNDSVFEEGINLDSIIIPLGYGELNRTVGLKVNEQGCVDSDIESVTVTPIVEIVADLTEGCTPLLVQFDAKSTEDVHSYLWDFGDGNSSDIKSPVNEFINAGIVDSSFDIGLTIVSVEGCENTGGIENMIVVHPKPTVDLSFEEEDCNPETMEIWYIGSGNENDIYHWDLSSFKSDEILNNPGETMGPLEIKRYSEPTANIGIHVVSEFACNSDTISKLWNRKPVFDLKVDTTEGCPPLLVTMQASVLDDVDEVSYTYTLGDGTTGQGDFVEHTYIDANTKNSIQFVGTSSITTCEETVLYGDSVFVFPVPQANFTPVPEVVVVSDPEVKFENSTSGANYYEWDFGDMSAISTEHSPTHRYTGMGFYTVVLAAFNDYNCLDSISSRVIVAFDRIFPPNAFSPNSSTEEDREFRIYSEGVADEGYQLLIFNRWGEVVFESNSQQNGWDGKMRNDKFAPAGVYTWTLQYKDFRGEQYKQQGAVSLLF